ncbi:MAG: hypothetical protein JSS75_00455 [Bacteroidetes bacterium]|nr:hypothetical protein [Bacteroidota bacterium]
MIRPTAQFVAFALLLAATLSSCLTAGHKEMRVSLNPDGKSGSAVILFTRIHSEASNDTADQTKDDFNSLISEYYQGKKLTDLFPNISNVKKRLFLDGNELAGELTFDFANIADLGFFRYKNSGPFMYYTLADGYFSSGVFEASNGSFGGDKMPLVFWDESSRDFFVKVALSQAQAPERSLVPLYKTWAKK